MITSTIIIIVSILIIVKECESQFSYEFPTSAQSNDTKSDEVKCDEIEMVHAGDLRRVSWTHLNRDAANACCNKRGMTLLSDDVGVTDDLVAAYIQNAEKDEEKDANFWTSGNDRNSPGSYKWELGHVIGTSEVYQWDSSVVEMIPDQCVLMKAENENLIHLTLADCSEEHPFICELEPKRAGGDLSKEEMEMCDNVEYIELLDLPNLRWGKMTARFPLAKYCCEQKGWSMADEFVLQNLQKLEKAYQDTKFQKETGLKYKFYVPHNAWIGYNDICRESKFVWNCGNETVYEGKKEWMPGSPNNEDGNEHCVHVGLRVATRRLQINDIDCDFSDIFVLCTTNATCPSNNQFKCPKTSKRKIYINDNIHEDNSTCTNLTFTYAGGDNLYNYFLSDQTMTWSGTQLCASQNNYELVSFQRKHEIEFLSRRYLGPSNSGGQPDVLPEIWNDATNWGLALDATIMWNARKPIKTEYLIDFHNHDDMYPLCGKTGIHFGVVGVLTENCLHKLPFMHKTRINSSIIANETNENESSEEEQSTVKNEVPHQLENKTEENPKNKTKTIVGRSKEPKIEDESPEKDDDVYYIITDENEKKGTDVSKSGFPEDKIIERFIDQNSSPDHHSHILCEDEYFHEKYQKACPDSATKTSYSNCSAVCRNSSEEEETEIGLQNNRLLSTGIKFAFDSYKEGDHKPLRSFHLLQISTKIYMKLCPVVTPLLLKKAFHYFHDLHGVLSQGRTEFLTHREYKWISSILLQCLGNATDARIIFTTDQCFFSIFGAETCTDFICTKPIYEFHICRSDPLVDVMWFVYELVHSACFPYFSKSYRMFHKYSMAIMDLWTKKIKLRWKTQIEQDKFWKRVLGPQYNEDLLKMQRCNKATIRKTELAIRLARHQLPDNIRFPGFAGY